MKKLHSLNWPFAFAWRIAAAASLVLLLIGGNLSAAISVGPSGTSGTLTFDTLPTIASGWSTATNLGGAGDAATGEALDALVITNEVANFTVPLIGSPTVPITAANISRWHSTRFHLMTPPTGVRNTLLLATLQNDTGSAKSQVTISYDLGENNAAGTTTTEEVPSHRVFYSLTGAAGSWTLIPEISSVTAPASLLVTLNLGTWGAGAPLYILWADDNAAADRNNGGTEEGGYTIDNFAANTGTVPPPVITVQPVNTTNYQTRTVSLSVTAIGGGLTYQWHKVGTGPINPIDNPTAATSTLVITNTAVSDSGDYFVVVANVAGGVTSQNAHIEILVDNIAPKLLSARILPSAGNNTFLLIVDEPLCVDFAACGSDANFQFNWEIQDASTGADLGVATIAIGGTNVTFTTSGTQESGKAYRIVVGVNGSGISDLFGNTIPLGEFVETSPTVTFQQNVGGYTGTMDTELRGAAPDTVQGANVGTTVDTDDGGGISHGLLRFDNIFGSNPGQIPVGSEIVSATLTIQHNAANANGNPVNLHRMLVGWDPTVVTYNSFTTGVQADGAEAATAIDAVIDSTGATVPFTREANVTATVQAWASGAPNFGWAFLPTGTDGYRMDTSESTTPPALTVAYRVVPCLNPPSITTQPPATISVNEGSTLSISVVFGNACETTYQWSKNGTDIPGATAAIYTESPAISGAGGSGGSYVLRATNPHGTVTSSAAVVTVVPDTIRPVVTSVRSTSATTITVGFSKVLSSGSAQNTANYVITPSVSVSAVVLSADGRSVTLTTGTRGLGTAYSLRIQNVTDNRGTPNLINPNPTIVPLTTISVIDDWNTAWSYNTNNLDATLSGTPWYSPAYTLGADWQTGNGLFGLETSAGIVALFPTPIATPLPANTATPPDMITFYFRKQINLPALPAGTTYAINHLIDDGAVFYLDGVEIGRLNQTNPAPVLYADRSSAAIEAALLSLPFTASAGTHTLAVEVHQGGTTTSSDVLFGARVIAIPTASPQLTISRSGVGAVVSWSADSNWDLQNANVVTGPYATLAPTAFGVYSNAIPATATNQFYRLQYRP